MGRRRRRKSPLPSPLPLALTLECVLGKLPTPTLAALRLVSRAARDLVDGRATRVRRLRDTSSVSVLVGAAHRLRSVSVIDVRIDTPLCDDDEEYDERRHNITPAACGRLAEVLKRLPGRGAALRELRAGPINLDCTYGLDLWEDVECLERLAAAVARLPALESAEFTVRGRWNEGAEALLSAAGRLRALARLAVDMRDVLKARRINLNLYNFDDSDDSDDPDDPGRYAPLPPRDSLQRLATLALDGCAEPFAPLLFGAATAGLLTRLRDLSVSVPNEWSRSPPPAEAWRAPWWSQLTRLALRGNSEVLRLVSEALAPRALRALRALEVESTYHRLTAAELRSLLGACDAPALHTLVLRRAAAAAVGGAAAELPALRALELHDAEFSTRPDWDEDQDTGADICTRAALAWIALCAAPLAPLTRLTLDVCDFALAKEAAPVAFAPLLGAGWARGLRALHLYNMVEPRRAGGGGGGGGGGWRARPSSRGGTWALYALRGLSALTALTKLTLEVNPELRAPALEAAARKGWAAGWAPRLREFALFTREHRLSGEALLALLKLPFGDRLERLVFNRPVDCRSDRKAFYAACTRRLPRLSSIEFWAARSMYNGEHAGL